MESPVSSSATHPTARADVPAVRHPHTPACVPPSPAHTWHTNVGMYRPTLPPAWVSPSSCQARQLVRRATSSSLRAPRSAWRVLAGDSLPSLAASRLPPPAHPPPVGPWRWNRAEQRLRCTETGTRSSLSSIGTRPDGGPSLHVCTSQSTKTCIQTDGHGGARRRRTGPICPPTYRYVLVALEDRETSQGHQRTGLAGGDISTASIGTIIRHAVYTMPPLAGQRSKGAGQRQPE